MSGLFNEASLVLVPSGYKAGKVYSEVPTNGDGDLTFTRASSATRVNSDGLIESPRTNLLLRSEEFDNASWEKFRAGTGSIPVVTANYSTAPDGSQTADRVQLSIGSGTTTGDISYLFQSASTSGATFSIYAKSNTTPCVVYFRNGDDVTTINITTSWQRFELFRSVSITGVHFGLRGADYGGATNSSTVDISVWGAQLEQGSTATEYIPTTNSARTTFAGITQDGTSASNVPRLDYSQGSCPALLLEPQRTNSIRNNTMVGASTSPSTLPTNWLRQNTSGLTQSVVGIGTENGVNYIDINLQGTASGANDAYSFDQTISASIGQTWTSSWYFKLVSSTPNAVRMAIQEFNGSSFLNVVLQDITPTTNLARYVQTKTLVGTGVTNVRSMIYVNFVIGQTYDTTIRIAAPQLEQGAYATSYIKTTSATVTRLADSFTRNNIYTNGLISASGGTWFVELKNNISYTRDSGSLGLNLDDSSLGNGFAIRNAGVGRLIIQKYIAGGGTTLYTTLTDTVKIAIKWNGTTADVFVNGTKQVSATSFTQLNMGNLNLSSGQVPYFIQAMQLYPTPLEDVDCEVLTGEIYTSYSEMATALGYTII